MNAPYSKPRWYVQSSLMGNLQASIQAAAQPYGTSCDHTENSGSHRFFLQHQLCMIKLMTHNFTLCKTVPRHKHAFAQTQVVSKRIALLTTASVPEALVVKPWVLCLHPSLESQCLEPNYGAADTQPRDEIVCTIRRGELWMGSQSMSIHILLLNGSTRSRVAHLTHHPSIFHPHVVTRPGSSSCRAPRLLLCLPHAASSQPSCFRKIKPITVRNSC